MFPLFCCFLVFMGLLFFILVVLLSFFFSGVSFLKSSPFECGFQAFSNSGVSFSMPFFVISLMFLLFDVEIIIMSFPSFCSFLFSGFMWVVVLLVLLATCYEWACGVFSWISSFYN